MTPLVRNLNKALLIFIGVLFLISDVRALKPEKAYKMTPETYGLPFKSMQVTTPDGAILNSWIIGKDSIDYSTTLIIVGSDAGNMGYQIQRAVYLLNQNIRVVLFDYRGFGQSSEFQMEKNQLYYPEFATDLAGVYGEVKERYPKGSLGFLGLSMGTWICKIVVSTHPPDYLIFEGLVLKPEIIKQRQNQLHDREVFLPHVPDSVVLSCQTNIPTLIFSGSKDEVTTVKDAEQYAKANENVQLVTYDGGHLQGIPILQLKYFEEIATFIGTFTED